MDTDEILNIQYNIRILEKFKELKISSDYIGSVFFILFALAEDKIKLMDIFDDDSSSRRAIILYRTLERRALIKETEAASDVRYKLTKLGEDLVSLLKEEFIGDLCTENFEASAVTEVVKKSKAKIPARNEFYEFADEYSILFPKHLRFHPQVVSERMLDFIDAYPEYNDRELILCATKMYIKHQENSESGHKFTRRDYYFLWKADEGPRKYDIATWCKRCLDEKNSPEFDTSIMDLV